jgi:hypothetical protein
VWIDITMLRRPTSDSFAQSVMSCLQRSPGHRAVSYDWLYISETAGCTLRSSRSQSSVCSGTCKAAHEYAELRCTHALSAIMKVGFVRLETCDWRVSLKAHQDLLILFLLHVGNVHCTNESCRRPANCLPIRRLCDAEPDGKAFKFMVVSQVRQSVC